MANFTTVCWSPELMLFCAAGYNGALQNFSTSPDGQNWTEQGGAVHKAWPSLCWAPQINRFCAVTNTNEQPSVAVSTDGTLWTFSKAPPFVIGTDGKRKVATFRPSKALKDKVN